MTGLNAVLAALEPEVEVAPPEVEVAPPEVEVAPAAADDEELLLLEPQAATAGRATASMTATIARWRYPGNCRNF